MGAGSERGRAGQQDERVGYTIRKKGLVLKITSNYLYQKSTVTSYLKRNCSPKMPTCAPFYIPPVPVPDKEAVLLL